ncbi:creatininase [Citricoccus sp. SGAir0253]|uniref:creatininase n=1 Tax=Citricoccus sp. SGAir0253 TaxID=2567881 RepID=UPI0010CD521D|nr:creatininase [Citricoccus sp. SGAir0253]QCU78913.1 creatininase [Citricoccus sp. SGAir0253]
MSTPQTTAAPGPSTAGEEVRLAHLDAHAYRDWAASGEATVIIPAGAFEQHGPHLPLGTDAILSTAIAEAMARRIGAKVAEPFTYGYKSQQKSGGGNHLAGTISLDATAVIAMTRCLVAGFLSQGIRNVVILNGHYENYQFLYEGVDLALADLGIGPGDDQCALLLSYWDFVTDETLATVYPQGFPGWAIEHGGVLETSLLLHLRPELVAMDRAVSHPPAEPPRFDRLPVVPGRTPATGCLSAPDGSDAAKGRLLFEQVVADLAADVAGELGAAVGPAGNASRATSAGPSAAAVGAGANMPVSAS